MDAPPTLYDVLDVSPDASRTEIQAAYREQVKETHPDVSDHPDAETRFKRVTRAKEVLTDPEERARYDRLGHHEYATREGWTDDPERSASDAATADAPDHEAETRSTTGPADGTDGDDRDDGATAAGTDGSTTDETATNTTDWRDRDGVSGGAGAGAAAAGGYATRTDYKEQSFDRVRVPLTPQSLIQVGTMFAFYPVFLSASLFPTFPTTVNVVVGLCTLFVIAYLLSIPEVGMVVFGGWGVLAPAVLFALPDVGVVSLVGVVALTACWVPFGLAVLMRAALRT